MNGKKIITVISYVLYGLSSAAAFALLIWFYLKGLVYATPLFFYLFIPLAVFLAAGAVIKAFLSPHVKYPLPKGVVMPKSAWTAVTSWTPFALTAAALILCVFALARPQIEGKTVLPPSAGVDIMLALDTSSSMLTPDLRPNRLEAAKAAAKEFISKRPTDRIGIVVFSGSAFLQCPITLDHAALEEFIDSIYIDMLGTAGTAVGDAVSASTLHLKDSVAKSKIIILITDGESNVGIDPIVATKAAQAYNIKIYTILISSIKGVYFQIPSPLGGMQTVKVDPSLGGDLLKEIAQLTGGEAFTAQDNEQLQNIYVAIDSLEKTDFKETVYLNYEDNYYRLLLGALILLLAAFAAEKFVFMRIP